MRKLLLTLLTVILAALVVMPMAAQDDTTCVRVVAEAFIETQESCADVATGQLCYGSGDVEAIPRYLTADFSFETPGDLLNISRIETIGTAPLDVETERYGVAQLQIGDPLQPVSVILFGNTFAANNVTPSLQLEMSAGTLATLQSEPKTLSERVGNLVPGDAVLADGRYNSSGGFEVNADTWVRIQSDFGNGWIPAGVIAEDYLVPSLTVVDPDEPVTAPMGAMSFVSGGDDSPCLNTPDSGMVVQSPDAEVNLRINGLRFMLAPTSTLFIQAQPNGNMNVFVLENAVTLGSGETSLRAAAGQVVGVPLGLDGMVSGMMTAPTPYLNAKVQPLATISVALPRELVITPGSDTLAAGASSEVVVSGETTSGGDMSGEVVMSTPTPADEVVIAEAVTAEPSVAEEAAAPSTTGSATSPFADEIRARGTIRVGVNGTLPAFSLEQDGQFTGFEVELAREVVQQLFGDSVAVEFVRVSARQRPTVLVDGTVDLMMRNSAFQPDRVSWGEWTNTFYFIDGQRVLVRADSGITSYADLNGQAIAVQAGTPTEQTLTDIAADFGFTVNAVPGVITDAFAMFTGGEAAAISADWTVLEALRATTPNPSDYIVIGEPLTDIPWNAVVPPGRTGFQSDVDDALLVIVSDGTWQQLYQQNFVSPLPDSLSLLFAPVEGTVVVAAEATPVSAEEVAPVATEANNADAAPTPAPTAAPITSNIPVTGDIPVVIFTAQQQQRTINIEPLDNDNFILKLVRGGEVVYEAEYRYYESADRYENIRNSFEYVTFSETAGDTSLGCSREPDVRGFFNGADFEGRLGC